MEDKKLNAGRVGLTMKGAWNASQSYEKLNCVSHNGRSWAAKKNVSAGVEPSAANSEFWQMISDRGEQGIQGPQGNSAFDGTGVEIVNNLTQGGEAAVLSAEQGKILKTELTELESNAANINKDVSLVVDGQFTISEDTWAVEDGYYHNATSITSSKQYGHAYVPIKNGKSITFQGITSGVSYGWRIYADGSNSPFGTSAGTYDITGAVALALNFFRGEYATEFIITSADDTHHEISEKVNGLQNEIGMLPQIQSELQTAITNGDKASSDNIQIEAMHRICADEGRFSVNVDSVPTIAGYITNNQGAVSPSSSYKCAKLPVPLNALSISYKATQQAGLNTLHVKYADGSIASKLSAEATVSLSNATEIYVNFFGEGYAQEYIIETAKSMSENAADIVTIQTMIVGDTSYSVKKKFLGQSDGKEYGGDVWSCTPYIRVYEGDVIKVSAYTYASVGVACYDENKNYLKDKSYIEATDGRTETEFIVPSGIAYIRSASADGMYAAGVLSIQTSERIEKMISQSSTNISNDDILKYGECLDKPFSFAGKTAIFFGDSITQGVESFAPNDEYIYGLKNAGDKKYSSLLCAKLGMTEVNKAISGSSFCKLNNSTIKSITETIQGTTSAADYIFVAGGVNDFQTGEPVGVLGDTTNATFYGCLDLSCKHLKATYPNAVVIFMTPINWCQSTNQQAIAPLNTYRNAIFEVATKYGFNVLDGSQVGFPTDSKSPFRPIMMYDGCHPTELGHSLYAKTLAGMLL